MDEDFINALFYSFLGTLGVMLLSTPSLNVILTTTWMGSFLLVYGIATIIFIALEKTSASNGYQEAVTIILLFIITGAVIASYGVDILKIIGAVSLSIAVGRAFTLLINTSAQLIAI